MYRKALAGLALLTPTALCGPQIAAGVLGPQLNEGDCTAAGRELMCCPQGSPDGRKHFFNPKEAGCVPDTNQCDQKNVFCCGRYRDGLVGTQFEDICHIVQPGQSLKRAVENFNDVQAVVVVLEQCIELCQRSDVHLNRVHCVDVCASLFVVEEAKHVFIDIADDVEDALEKFVSDIQDATEHRPTTSDDGDFCIDKHNLTALAFGAVNRLIDIEDQYDINGIDEEIAASIKALIEAWMEQFEEHNITEIDTTSPLLPPRGYKKKWKHVGRHNCAKKCVKKQKKLAKEAKKDQGGRHQRHHHENDSLSLSAASKIAADCNDNCSKYECFWEPRCMKCVKDCSVLNKSDNCEAECKAFYVDFPLPVKRDSPAQTPGNETCVETCDELGGTNCEANCHEFEERSRVDSCTKKCSKNGGPNCEEDCKNNQCFMHHRCAHCIKECIKHGGLRKHGGCAEACMHELDYPVPPGGDDMFTAVDATLEDRSVDDTAAVEPRMSVKHCYKKCVKHGGTKQHCADECNDNICHLHHTCRQCVRHCIKHGGSECEENCTNWWILNEEGLLGLWNLPSRDNSALEAHSDDDTDDTTSLDERKSVPRCYKKCMKLLHSDVLCRTGCNNAMCQNHDSYRDCRKDCYGRPKCIKDCWTKCSNEYKHELMPNSTIKA